MEDWDDVIMSVK